MQVQAANFDFWWMSIHESCVGNMMNNFTSSFSLKCYYDQKITFIFSWDFETRFVKHSPSEIISVNFEKKTVNLNCNFSV